MSLEFQCPSCKRSLQFAGGDSLFQVCRYCKGKIIVPSTVVHEQQLEGETRGTPKAHRDLKLAEIQRELSAGRSVEAVKIFRETFGTDMKSALSAIQSMQQNEHLNLPNPANPQNPIAASAVTEDKIYGGQSNQQNAPVRSRLFVIVALVSIGIILSRCMGGS